MTDKTIADFKYAHCRIQSVIHLASLIATDPDCEAVQELCEWLDDELIQNLGKQDMRLKAALEGISLEGGAEPDTLIDNMHNCGIYVGFILGVSTPAPQFRTPRENCNASYSWGMTHFTWVFGNTMSEAEQRAIDWAKDTWKRAHEIAKAKAEA